MCACVSCVLVLGCSICHYSKQKEVINNFNKFYNSWEEVINFFGDYIEIISDSAYIAKQDGAGLKIVTPKQMLQRLSIA